MNKFENLIPYRKSIKWGFADKNLTLQVPCVYDYTCPFEGSLAAVEMNKLWGAVNLKGQLVIPCVYQKILVFTEGVAAGTRDGKLYEYIGEDGDLITNPVFEYCGHFKNGLAIVCYERRYGVINRNLETAIDAIYDGLEPYGESFYRYKSGGYWGVISNKGEEILSAEFDEISELKSGRAVVKKSFLEMAPHVILDENGDGVDVEEIEELVDRYGIVDTTGNVILACEKDKITTFNENVAMLFTGYEDHYEWALIDKDGKDILGFNSSDIRDYSGYGTIVLKNDNWGVVNARGQWIIKAKYEVLNKFTNGFYLGAFISDDKKLLTWDYIDSEGTIITSVHNFDYVGEFVDAVAVIKKDEKYGYINLSGEVIISPQFDYAHDFCDGLARVKMNKWGFVNIKGEVVIDCKYDVLGDFINGFAEVRDWSESGYREYNPSDFQHPGFWNTAELKDNMAGEEIPWQPLMGYINKTGQEFFNGYFAHTSLSY